MDSDRIVRDLIISALAGRGRRPSGLGQVLSAIYLARTGLPEGDRIRDAAPYYWYIDGPDSDPVSKVFAGMVGEGAIVGVPHAARGMFRLSGGVAPEDGGEAADAARRHAAGFGDAFKAPADLCAGHLPYGFYAAYRRDLVPLLEGYCDDVIRHGGTDGAMRRGMLDSLTGAIAEIPPGREFMRFRMAISSYARSLRVLFQEDGVHDGRVPGDAVAARRVCGMVWTAFGCHARIACHDPYYDNRVGGWRAGLEEQMAALEDETRVLEESVDRIPVLEGYSKRTQRMIDRCEAGEFDSARSYSATEYLEMITARIGGGR